MSKPCVTALFILLLASTAISQQQTRHVRKSAHTYLGFDRNIYPGDQSLAELRKSFSFAGYWLNNPPGESSNTWQGKRQLLESHDFGFLVLFNGKRYAELKPPADPVALGKADARAAADSARTEGFPANTVIFLDIEEGGRLLRQQHAYLQTWADELRTHHYYAASIALGFRCARPAGLPSVQQRTSGRMQQDAQ